MDFGAGRRGLRSDAGLSPAEVASLNESAEDLAFSATSGAASYGAPRRRVAESDKIANKSLTGISLLSHHMLIFRFYVTPRPSPPDGHPIESAVAAVINLHTTSTQLLML